MNIKDIPVEYRDDKHIETYTVRSETGVIIFQAKRTHTDKDLKPIMQGSKIIRQGTYFGQWEDNTALAKALEQEKHKKEFTSAANVANVANAKETELARAQALLKQLQNMEEEQ